MVQSGSTYSELAASGNLGNRKDSTPIWDDAVPEWLLAHGTITQEELDEARTAVKDGTAP